MLSKPHYFSSLRILLLLLPLLFPFVTDSLAESLNIDSDNLTFLGQNDINEEEQQLQQLLAILDKHTELATKSKLNADFVPGMITVFNGRDLEARGIRTVWQALGLVPGIEISLAGSGNPEIVVRGIGRTFGSGIIKYMVDGISVNSTFLGQNSPVLEIPVAQIDRLEVIRGPGSALHGEFALAGVVNIITRKEGDQLFGHLGQYNTYSGGGLFSWTDPDHNRQFSLNLAGTQSDGADVTTGPDVMYNLGLGAISNAPGPANEEKEAFSSFINLRCRNFSLDGQYVREGHGSHFGSTYILGFDQDRIILNHEYALLQGAQKIEFSSSLLANLQLGWSNYTFESDHSLVYPPGFPGFANGRFNGSHYEESKWFGGLDLNWTKWQKHNLLLAWSFSYVQEGDVYGEGNALPSTGAPLATYQTFTGSENWMVEDVDRLLNSITFQDEFTFNNDITITAGLRYDNYDDIGNSLTPRLALIWDLNEYHIVKAQYARAFRPPSFLEMNIRNNPSVTGNSSIDPTTIDSYELSYIYHQSGTTSRATLFYSSLEDLIVVESSTYINSGGAVLQGLELELEQKLSSLVKIDLNLSYSDTKDKDTSSQIAGAANWLANGGIFYEPRQDVNFHLQYCFVGQRNRRASDQRDNLAAYQTVDLTANIFNLFGSGITTRAGLANIFAEDVRYASPSAAAYPEDLPRPGRTWWLQLSYEF